jgi:hypothetical protein
MTAKKKPKKTKKAVKPDEEVPNEDFNKIVGALLKVTPNKKTKRTADGGTGS